MRQDVDDVFALARAHGVGLVNGAALAMGLLSGRDPDTIGTPKWTPPAAEVAAAKQVHAWCAGRGDPRPRARPAVQHPAGGFDCTLIGAATAGEVTGCWEAADDCRSPNRCGRELPQLLDAVRRAMPPARGQVMTVRGPVDAADLGITLPHEHVYLNLMLEYKKEGVLNDEPLAVRELQQYVEAGGRTLVDCTSVELDRDPLALRRAAEATGLNVVMGCGHYRDPYIDRDHLDRRGVDGLAADLIAEIRDGFEDTGIRPGIIGEVGSNRKWISSAEERALRVAARASVATGLTVMTHAARWPLGIPQLDILEEAGVNPRTVVVGHCDMVPSTGVPRGDRGARGVRGVRHDPGRQRVRHQLARRLGDEPRAQGVPGAGPPLARRLPHDDLHGVRRSGLRVPVARVRPAPAGGRPGRRGDRDAHRPQPRPDADRGRPLMERIGWIGLGLMGSRMLPHLMAAGHQATVNDHFPALAAPHLAAGAVWADRPCDVAAASDVVFTIVATPADVEAVYLGPDGLLAGARPGLVLVDMTSSSTQLARRLAEAGAAVGVDVLDAPVSGGPAGAETGTLAIMVGGDAEVLARVRPLLERLGAAVVHHGPAGAGQSMKITNQIAMAGAMLGVCESFLFAKANGLDQQVVFETLSAGIAGSPLMRYIWPRLASRDMEPGFRVEHLLKDLGLALDAAHDATIALPGTALVKELYHEVRAAGYAGKGTQALIAALDRHWEDDAGPA